MLVSFIINRDEQVHSRFKRDMLQAFRLPQPRHAPAQKSVVAHEDPEVSHGLSLLLKAYTRPLHIRITYSVTDAIYLMSLGYFDVALLQFNGAIA